MFLFQRRMTANKATRSERVRRWAEVAACYAKIVHTSTGAIPSFSREIDPQQQQTTSIISQMSTQRRQWAAGLDRLSPVSRNYFNTSKKILLRRFSVMVPASLPHTGDESFTALTPLLFSSTSSYGSPL